MNGGYGARAHLRAPGRDQKRFGLLLDDAITVTVELTSSYSRKTVQLERSTKMAFAHCSHSNCFQHKALSLAKARPADHF
jgi:hypothetical protein